LDGIALPRLRIGTIAQLDEDRLALSRAFDRSAKETPSAVRNHGFHGFADDLGDKHSPAQATVRFDRDPLETVVLDMLRIAEGAGRRLERYQRDARHVPLFLRSLDPSQTG